MRLSFFDRLPVRLGGIILLLGFIVVPLVAELERHAMERIVLQQAEAQSAVATVAAVDGLQDVMRSVEKTVQYLARDLEDRPLNADEVDRILHNVMAGTQDFSEFSIAFEPGALNPGMVRFGRYLGRSDGHLVTRDLADNAYRYWTRDWYTDTLGRSALTWSEPFFDTGGANANVVRISAPFFRTVGGHRVAAGVVSAGLTLDWVRELTEENQFFDTGYVLIFSQGGRLITHPNPHYVFTETMDSLAQKTGTPQLAQIYQRVLSRRQGSLSYLSNDLHVRVHEDYKPVRIGGWGVVVGYQESEFLRQLTASRWIMATSLGATLLLFSLIVVLATRFALRPLGEVATVADEITQGKLDREIHPPRRNDEIGRMTRSFRLMQQALKRNRELEAAVQVKTAETAAANDKLRAENLERRWTLQALEHQRRYDQLIINSIEDLVFVVTKAVNISRVNPAVVRATGWELTELINTPLGGIVAMTAAAGATPADPIAQALADGRELRDLGASLRTKAGPSLTVQFTVFPLRDRDKVVGGIAIVRLFQP